MLSGSLGSECPSTWSKQAVSVWLTESKFPHLVAKFAEENITGDALIDLTEGDLTELGLKFGDKKSLCKRIAALKQQQQQGQQQEHEDVFQDAVGTSPIPLSQRLNVNEQDAFLFASLITQYMDLEPSSELAKFNLLPQFSLWGDQSSGKTTILSRLAGVPLGYTCIGIGTRRPFKFTFLRDPSSTLPKCEVDNVEVPEDKLNEVLTEKNKVGGFTSDPVAVRISSNYVTSLSIDDLPGFNADNLEPEKIALEHLKRPGMTPIVVLDPKDLNSAHAVYKVLEKAERDKRNTIAIINKIDEKITESGEWNTADAWKNQLEAAQKLFRKAFFTGWFFKGNRNSKTKDMLTSSYAEEEKQVEEWGSRISPPLDNFAKSIVGLGNFKKFLHSEQLQKLKEFTLVAGPCIQADLHRETKKRLEMEQNQTKQIQDQMNDMLYAICQDGIEIVDGNFDVHEYSVYATTLYESLDFLLRNQNVLETLPQHDEYPCSKVLVSEMQQRADLSWAVLLQAGVYEKGLLGKAALERSADIVSLWSWFKSNEHLFIDFTEEFEKNIRAKSHEDTGNKVILQFKKRMHKVLFHPLVEVFCVLVQQEVTQALSATIDNVAMGKPWGTTFKKYDRMGFGEEMKKLFSDIARKLVHAMNRDLHKHLDVEQNDLRCARVWSEAGDTMRSNTSGITDAIRHSQVGISSGSQFQTQRMMFLKMSVFSFENTSYGATIGRSAAIAWKDPVWEQGGSWKPEGEYAGSALESFFSAEFGDINYNEEYKCIMGAKSWESRSQNYKKQLLRSPKLKLKGVSKIVVVVSGLRPTWLDRKEGVHAGAYTRSWTVSPMPLKDEYGTVGVLLRNTEDDIWIDRKTFINYGTETIKTKFEFVIRPEDQRKIVTLDILDDYYREGYHSWISCHEVRFENSDTTATVAETPSESTSFLLNVPFPCTSREKTTEPIVQLQPDPQENVRASPEACSFVSTHEDNEKNLSICLQAQTNKLRAHYTPPKVSVDIDFSNLQKMASFEVLTQIKEFGYMLSNHLASLRQDLRKILARDVVRHFEDRIAVYTHVEIDKQKKRLQRIIHREKILNRAHELWEKQLGEMSFDD